MDTPVQAATPAFSKVRRGGGLLFVSSEVAHRPEGSAPAGVFCQTELVLEHLASTLAREGHQLSDVVQVTAYMSRAEDFAEFNRAYCRHFRQPYPVRTTVVAQPLYPHSCVEMVVIAAERAVQAIDFEFGPVTSPAHMTNVG